MKLRIDDRVLPAKNIQNGRLRDLIALQNETGWTMLELREQIAAQPQIYGSGVLMYLTLRGAGDNVTWDEILDRDADSWDIIPEPGDVRHMAGADASEPDQPPAASAAGGASPEAEQATTPA